jgi:proteasome lid subunit RPN8/RPN11
MYEDPSVPVGATQATVAMVSACMVYAAQRILQGATTLKDRFFTWGFPDRILPLELATSKPKRFRIREIVIPDGGTPVRELLQKVDEHFPGHYMLIEHPFIIEWDCLGGCGKPISIGRYHHHLSDSDRFHDACLKGNEHLLHLNMSQPQLAVSDRLSLESDDRILSLSVQEIGLMEDSIRRICCKDGRLAAIRIKYGLPKHSSLILNETALIDMTSHGMETAKSSGHEAAGLLFGHVTGDQVHVTTFVPAEVETSTPYYVQISSEWMARILYEYEDSSLSLCGWWHSHPGFGLRPSSRDIETFAYFSGKNHFSLIQDPTATDYALAVYQYSEGEVVSRDFRLKSKDGRMIKYKRTT